MNYLFYLYPLIKNERIAEKNRPLFKVRNYFAGLRSVCKVLHKKEKGIFVRS
jgi:hypothetical protein